MYSYGNFSAFFRQKSPSTIQPGLKLNKPFCLIRNRGKNTSNVVLLYDWPTKVTYIPTPLQLVATTPLHWLCICQNTHLFAKRESRVNTVQNSAALEKDPLKIYAIMCNMRRLNSHRELGKFLHTAAATAAAAKLRRASLPFSRWSHFVYIATASKGQIISEWKFDVWNFPKKQLINLMNFCLII